jgi:hypothetical protein
MLGFRPFHPVLASLGWAAIILIAILLAILVFLLLAAALKSAQASLGGKAPPAPPPPPPPSPADQTLSKLQDLLKKIDAAGGPSGDDCSELRSLLQQAKAQGASSDLTDNLQKLIDNVCPG